MGGGRERSRSKTRADKDEHNTHNLACLCVVQEKRSEEQKEEEEGGGEKEEGRGGGGGKKEEGRGGEEYLVQYLKFRLDLSLFLYSCVQS